MDWDKLRIFQAVAEAGSLTHAGDELHLSQSSVSRQMRALEESLGTILFHRHARGLILTEQGEVLLEATKAMSKRLDAASARIKDTEEGVFGNLRVTTTTGFGSLWLAPRLNKFYSDFPEVQVDLMLEERVLDLPMREADVAIRMKEPSQADLIRKRIMTVRIGLYASAHYIQTHPAIEDESDLKDHRLICQRPEAPQVAAGFALIQKLMSMNVLPSLCVNNYFGVLQATVHHLGVGVLPDYVAHDFDGLRRVLPDLESAEVPVYIAYPEELRQSQRIQAFRDFVEKEIELDRRLRQKG